MRAAIRHRTWDFISLLLDSINVFSCSNCTRDRSEVMAHFRMLYTLIWWSLGIPFTLPLVAEAFAEPLQDHSIFTGSNLIRLSRHNCKRFSFPIRDLNGQRRLTCIALVMGNSLYIDGGEINYVKNGTLNGITTSRTLFCISPTYELRSCSERHS